MAEFEGGESPTKNFLMKKIGPLPLAAWVVIGAGLGLTIVYMRRGKSAVTATPASSGSVATPSGGGSFNGQNQGDPFATQNLADSIANLNTFLTTGQRTGTIPGVSSGGTALVSSSPKDIYWSKVLGQTSATPNGTLEELMHGNLTWQAEHGGQVFNQEQATILWQQVLGQNSPTPGDVNKIQQGHLTSVAQGK